jgi:hypothetical protein
MALSLLGALGVDVGHGKDLAPRRGVLLGRSSIVDRVDPGQSKTISEASPFPAARLLSKPTSKFPV